jgi:hypothetical protein
MTHRAPRVRARAPMTVALVACLLGPNARIAAQETVPSDGTRRSAAVTVEAGTITLDGLLDEPIWKTTPTIGDLIQRQPIVGAAPTERTDVILLRDDDNLYVGVVAFDSEPERITGTEMARDGSINVDDRIEILLDTFRDQRSAFYFATNASGALVDGLVFGNAQLNTEWDAIWDVRTRRIEEGWTAEFAIPFKSLGFPADQSTWGFNVARTIARKSEDDRWSGARLETRFLQVSEAGEITNLGKLTQGKGLDIRPFMAGRWLHLGGPGTDDADAKPGVDVFYNVTPSLKLTTTVNTDFGETEVDARQINLSRFSLLFPEKRAFFLEGAGVFNFASTGPQQAGGIPATGADVYPFFSRQIGLLRGEEVPIDVGVKLTGTVGRTDVGVLDVRTRDVSIVDARNFFVARLKRNLFQQSYVGVLLTNGNPALEQSAQTFGADLRLATSRFLGGSRNFVVNAYASRSVIDGRSGDDWSYGLSADYPNDKFDAQVVYREIQELYTPALGFVQRNNVRLFRVAGSYNPRPTFWNILQMFHDVYYTRFTRLDNGELESWDLYVTWLDWHFKSGDNIHGTFDFNPTYERLFEPFEISPGVVLAPGEYRFTRFRANPFSTATRRRLSGSLNILWGNYWSGEAEQVIANVAFKAPPWFSMTLSTNQTFASLPEGDFTARIMTANVAFAASPRLSFANLIQYDNRSRNLGWQSRARWTLQPGSDLFVSFNQGWIQEEPGSSRFSVQDTKLSAKAQYTWRF